MRYQEKTWSALAATVVIAASMTAAIAETTFVAMLDGQQNVPSRPEVTATGEATLTLNDDQTELAFAISYAGLSSDEIGAHIHNAGPRENGTIVFELPAGNPKVGTWAIPPEMVTELLAGRIYINIHTQDYVGGEIRGNVHEAVPVRSTSWGRVKTLFARRAP